MKYPLCILLWFLSLYDAHAQPRPYPADIDLSGTIEPWEHLFHSRRFPVSVPQSLEHSEASVESNETQTPSAIYWPYPADIDLLGNTEPWEYLVNEIAYHLPTMEFERYEDILAILRNIDSELQADRGTGNYNPSDIVDYLQQWIDRRWWIEWAISSPEEYFIIIEAYQQARSQRSE